MIYQLIPIRNFRRKPMYLYIYIYIYIYIYRHFKDILNLNVSQCRHIGRHCVFTGYYNTIRTTILIFKFHSQIMRAVSEKIRLSISERFWESLRCLNCQNRRKSSNFSELLINTYVN